MGDRREVAYNMADGLCLMEDVSTCTESDHGPIDTPFCPTIDVLVTFLSEEVSHFEPTSRIPHFLGGRMFE